MSAAVLGLAGLPEFAQGGARSSPGETLDPEEQAVFAAAHSRPDSCGLIVLARADGRPNRRGGSGGQYCLWSQRVALAVRQDAATAAQVFNILHDERFARLAGTAEPVARAAAGPPTQGFPPPCRWLTLSWSSGTFNLPLTSMPGC